MEKICRIINIDNFVKDKYFNTSRKPGLATKDAEDAKSSRDNKNYSLCDLCGLSVEKYFLRFHQYLYMNLILRMVFLGTLYFDVLEK